MDRAGDEDWWRALTPAHLVAVAAALLGFVLNFPSENRTEVDGIVVACDYVDYVAIVVGGVTVVAAVVALVRTVQRRSAAHRTLLLIVAGLAELVGLVHILRGLGVFHTC